MRWWIQNSAEWTLARLPGGRWLHARLRERSGELARLEQSSRFDNAAWFLRTARQLCGELGDVRAVELGTGWAPAVPLAFLACGVRVETYDVARLAKPALVGRTINEVRRRAADYAAAAELPLEAVHKRLAQIGDGTDFGTVCRRLGGCYRAPFDTSRLPYPDGEADLVFSNLVLQCIPLATLRSVIEESLRVLRPGGLAIHRIRMTDEAAANDPQRNHLEYLKYDQRTWQRWFCHRLKHLNRLRASQFIEIFREAGFDCRQVERHVDRESIPFLERLPLPYEFRDLTLEDLATVNLDIVLQKPATRRLRSQPSDVPTQQPLNSAD